MSRSWNRAYLMGAAEKVLGQESSLQLQGRVWRRLRESGDDENPGIQNYTGLRYHLQLFSGYGDSLVDYNRRRTALSFGLSLVDW